MAAGGPGDHPLKDILHFNMEVYNAECDKMIIELSKYISEDELYESIDWSTAFNITESKLQDFKIELSNRLIALRD